MARELRKITLGKKKCTVTYCSEAIPYDTGTQTGIYYEVDAKIEGMGERPLQITSDHPLKEGQELVVNFVVESQTALKVKARKEQKEK